ncbi:PQQ-binding-like beta-propeller repeat protein [Hahella sp. HN01]|uniref:golvesin C-terminal-like domain-containing protein n=1 Tax=Hahella sp. HN01 TaxID=2847262 RepID=UPI001C1E90BC|nr:PQQ-binding-like beta-propeller repeat protein [Hahella sp. HN01]MBU6951602.1 PQQ-binding-like beta-propeller repeat protein [Hahella sp. HN01]
MRKWLMGLGLASTLAQPLQAEEIRDYYSEPGLNPFQSTINQSFNEHIDPFSGGLSLKYTDVFLPGNGGMDVRINRIYNSIQTNAYPIQSQSGFGWTMHFGRIVASKQYKDRLCNQALYSVTTKDNPSLEFSDGGRELLLLSAIHGNDNTLITRSNWKATCLSDGNGMLVTSPSGVRYTMNKYDYFQEEPSWLTTRIEDLHGNWIRIEYETNPVGVSLLNKIYRSEEGDEQPIVTFEYADPDNERARIVAINAKDQRWEYQYEGVPSVPHANQLTQVIRPDHKAWQYAYNDRVADPNPDDDINEDGLGSYSLNHVTYPEGGEISYTYQYVKFDPGTEAKTTSILTKEVSGIDVENGIWTYAFTPHSYPYTDVEEDGAQLRLDVTEITTPSNKQVFRHYGKDYHRHLGSYHYTRPSFVGLLHSQLTYDLSGNLLERRAKAWGGRRVSDENFFHGSPDRSWWQDHAEGEVGGASYAPILLAEYTSRDSYAQEEAFIFGTLYEDHDDFGNPGTVIEGGAFADQPNRVTKYQYKNDTTRWLIGLPVSEKILAGEELKGEVSKVYNELGQLEEENKFGVITKYAYHPDGMLKSVEDARHHVTTYLDYKRGSPQREEKPENIVLYREINDDGTLAWEKDGEGNKVSYDYDELKRLKSIDYPIHDSVSVVYEDNLRTLSRGSYKQIDQFDGFGQLIKSTRQDTTTGESIETTTKYDALGQKKFESYPNSPSGNSYKYDALGRLVKKTLPDSNFIEYQYDEFWVTSIDERKNSTKSTYRKYGASGQPVLISVEQPESIKTIITRNLFDQIVEVTQGERNSTGSVRGDKRKYIYDDKHFLIEKTDPETGTVTYERDGLGNVISEAYEGKDPVNYKYDGLNRLYFVDYPNGTPDIEKQFDKNGNLKKLVSGMSEWAYEYDANGNLTDETLNISGILPKTYHLHYDYDPLDTLNKIVYPKGFEVDYLPNAFGRPTKVGAYARDLTFHPGGQLKSYTLSNGVTTTLTLDNRFLPRKIQSGDLVNLTYSYDNSGNVTSILDAIDPSQNIKMDNPNSYDKLHRLRSANGPWGTIAYEYSADGDILKKTQNGTVTDYYYNANKMMAVKTSSIAETAIKYDAFGNITHKIQRIDDGNDGGVVSSKQYRYDAASRLIHSDAKSQSKRYAYDGAGQRFFEQAENSYDLVYSTYSSSGQLLYEESIKDCSGTYYVRVGSALIAKVEDADDTPDKDADADLIRDCLEVQLGLSPTDQNDGLFGDSDSDGIVNKDEISLGTALTGSGDTDGDGVKDGDEVSAGTNPTLTDSDWDGIPDDQELANPALNPLLADSDHDGVSDYWEIVLRSNPADATDAYADSDLDGFSNRQESLTGFNPNSKLITPASGSLAWSFEVGGQLEGDVAIDGNGVVYVGSRDGFLYAIYPDGTLKWKAKLKSIIGTSAPPAIGVDGSVYIGDYDGYLYAFTENGELKEGWPKSVGSVESAAAFDSNGNIYIGTRGGYIYAFSTDGEELWRQYIGAAMYASPIITVDDVLYITAVDGRLYALSLDGKIKWAYKAAGYVTSSPAIGYDGTIYFGSRDHSVYAIYPSGRLKWKYDTGEEVRSSPVVGKDYLYIGTYTGRLLALGHQTGDVVGEYNTNATISGSPAIGRDGTVYVANEAGYVYGLNSSLSSDTPLEFYYPTYSNIHASVILDKDGMLFVTNYAGRVFAIADNSEGPAATAWPQFQHDHYSSGNQCRYEGGIYSKDGDSDTDKIHDCYEFAHGLNPHDSSDAALDADGDGLSNLEEYQQGTSMQSQDSDGDGLDDYSEIYTHMTKPMSWDTDGDGLSDKAEIDNKLDPNDFSDAFADSDKDGFSNIQEGLSGSDPFKTEVIPSRGYELWSYYGSDVLTDVAIAADGALYFGSSAGELFAVNPSGEEKWRINTGGGISAAPVIAADGSIVVLNGSFLSMYRPDKSLKWSVRYKPDFRNSSDRPAIAPDGTIFVFASQPSKALAFNPEDGSVIPEWEIAYDDGFITPLILSADGIAYYGDVAGLNAISLDKGFRRLFSTYDSSYSSTGGSVRAAAINGDGSILIGASNGFIYSLTSEGTELWAYDVGGSVKGIVTNSERQIYVVADNGVVNKLSPNGELLSSRSLDSSVEGSLSLASNGAVYVVTSTYLYALSSALNIEWRLPITKGRTPIVSTLDGTVYLSTKLGRLNAYVDNARGPVKGSWFTSGHDTFWSGSECRFDGGYYDPVNDADGDFIPDCYESARGLDLNRIEDGEEDSDNDGLVNTVEYELRTNFYSSDTDQDGLNDKQEVELNTDPLDSDTDNDGLSDGYEVAHSMNPKLNAEIWLDSDSDGFSNRQEMLAKTNVLDPESTPTNGLEISPISGSFRGDVAIDENGVLYVGRKADLKVAAYDLYGILKWESAALEEDVRGLAVGPNGEVYATTDTLLYSIEPDTGAVKWKAVVDVTSFSEATVGIAIASDGTVYVLAAGGVFAFDPESPEPKWNYHIPEATASQNLIAVGKSGDIYIGGNLTGHKKVYKLDSGGVAADVLYDLYDSEGGLTGLAIGADDALYVSTTQGLLCFSGSGELKWKRLEGRLVTPPVIGANDVAYVAEVTPYSGPSTINGFTANGETIWAEGYTSGEYVDSLAVAKDGTVYASTFEATDSWKRALFAVTPEGQRKWWKRTGYNPDSAPLIDQDGVIFFLSENGKLWRILDGTGGPAASLWPMLGGSATRANRVPFDGDQRPVLRILSPASSSIFGLEDEIHLSATATDKEDGDLGESISWSSDVDGLLETGGNITVKLSAGERVISASVVDSAGNRSQDSVRIRVNQPPVISILRPSKGEAVTDGIGMTLVAQANDPEDGPLLESIVWRSDLDGVIASVSDTSALLSVGQHLITAEVADADGASAIAQVNVIVHAADAYVDSDSDGIPDFWEVAHGLDSTNASDRYGDVNLDGLNNYRDYIRDTQTGDANGNENIGYRVVSADLSGKPIAAVSLENENSIRLGPNSISLDKGELVVLPNAEILPGTTIKGTKPFSLGSEEPWMTLPTPEAFKGVRFAYPLHRGRHYFHIKADNGATYVSVKHGLKSETLVVRDEGDFSIELAQEATVVEFKADAPIYVTHLGESNAGGKQDESPLLPAGLDLWGIGEGVVIGGLEDDTQVQLQSSSGYSKTISIHAGEFYSAVVDGAAESQPALHIASSKPLVAYQVASSSALTYELVDAPQGMTIDPDTGRVQWSPGDTDAGDHLVTIRAQDGVKSTQQSYTLSVRAVESNAVPIPFVVDNGDPATLTVGSWPTSTYQSGYYGTNYQSRPAGSGSNKYIWNIGVGQEGNYRVYAQWTAQSSRASNAEYVIATSAGNETVYMDQRSHGGTLNLLGVFPLNENSSVTLTDSGNGYVIADAIKVEWAATSADSFIIDNSDSSTNAVGGWPHSSYRSGYYGSDYQYETAGSGSKHFSWLPNISQAGDYQVFARWTADGSRANNAKYKVVTTTGEQTIVVDQRVNGDSWQRLGLFSLGSNAQVTLSDDANGSVIADAIKFEATHSSPTTGNQAPVFSTPATTFAKAGLSYEYTASANDPDGDTVTYAIEYGPLAMTIDSVSGDLQWTPSVEDLGEHLITLVASDGDTVGRQSYTLLVVSDESGSISPVPVVIDNTDSQTTATGTWGSSSAITGFYGSNYQYASPRSNSTFTWRPSISVAGSYHVYARWAAQSNRTSTATYRVKTATGNEAITVNQRINGGSWQLLGTYELDGSAAIALSDDVNGVVIADAIQIEWAGGETPSGGEGPFVISSAVPTSAEPGEVYDYQVATTNSAAGVMDVATFFDRVFLAKRYAIADKSSRIDIVCSEPNTEITLYDGVRTPRSLSCDAGGDFPGIASFEELEEGAGIGAGALLESNHPIYLNYRTLANGEIRNVLGY